MRLFSSLTLGGLLAALVMSSASAAERAAALSATVGKVEIWVDNTLIGNAPSAEFRGGSSPRVMIQCPNTSSPLIGASNCGAAPKPTAVPSSRTRGSDTSLLMKAANVEVWLGDAPVSGSSSVVLTSEKWNQRIMLQCSGDSTSSLGGPVCDGPVAVTASPASKDCDVCPEMVEIPQGRFLMGTPFRDDGHAGTQPRHLVNIEKRFAIGKYEVTFDEWEACVKDGGCYGYSPNDRGWGRGRQPVINISWKNAESYVEWLSKKTGQSYRLPSEAEWEYAARAGTKSTYSWGDNSGHKLANCDGCSGFRADPQKSLPVGSFPANPFGLYDVHGNVAEWVEDCWHWSYYGAPTDGSVWKSDRCETHVYRGGSWKNTAHGIESSDRSSAHYSKIREDKIGFRVAKTLVE